MEERPEAAQTQASNAAHYLFSQTTAGLTKAVNDLSAALDKEAASSQRAQFQTLAKAEADRVATIRARQKAAASLAAAVADAKAAGTINFGAGGAAGAQLAQGLYTQRLSAAERELAVATDNVAKAESNVVKSRAAIVRGRVEESLNAATAATKRYERASDILYAKLKRGQITEAVYGGAVKDLAQRRDNELAAAQASQRKAGGSTRARAQSSVSRTAIAAVDPFKRAKDALNNDLDFARDNPIKDLFKIKDGEDLLSEKAVDEAVARLGRLQEVRQDQENDLYRRQQENISSLASLYMDAFEGGTKGVWDTFKREGLRAIAIVLAQLTLGKSLKSAIGSISGGGDQASGLANVLGSLFGGGRASGGNVVAGKLYKINERGPELFQPGQSGKIYPTGSIGGAAGRGGQVVNVYQTHVFDARGGVTTPDLIRQFNAVASQKAAQAGKAAYDNSPARAARLNTLGT